MIIHLTIKKNTEKHKHYHDPPLCEVEFPSLCEVECSNKFGLLATQEEEAVVIEVGAGEGDRTPKANIVRRKLDGNERKEGGKVRKDRERLEGSLEVLVLGDSRIKYLDEIFCEVDRMRRMTFCLPEAGVQDVVERYKRVVEEARKDTLVVVHVGVNDVGRVRSEVLVDRYRELLREIKESGKRCIVSGVLPR